MTHRWSQAATGQHDDTVLIRALGMVLNAQLPQIFRFTGRDRIESFLIRRERKIDDIPTIILDINHPHRLSLQIKNINGAVAP